MTLNPTELPQIAIWTDGSTYPTNPGPHGGWAAILISQDGSRIRALSGYFCAATNQRAEAYAVLWGLRALTRPCRVLVMTDSEYVLRGLDAVMRNKRLKANMDIWSQFTSVVAPHKVHAEHVFGHSGIQENEWANKLAYEAAISRQGIDAYFSSIPLRARRGKHG